MRYNLKFSLAACILLVSGSPTLAAAPSVQENLDLTWIMVSAALVLLMQIGFLLLEAGLVRSKNSINVAQKNLTDFLVCACSFGTFGFMIMFGLSQGIAGFEPRLLFFPGDTDQEMAFFTFQVMFCGTAATIVSGAVAERFSFTAYLLSIPFIAIIIYPVFGHLAWGNLFTSDNAAFLADLGFVDFAGSTVVHALGGWLALAAIICVGPRLGRFRADGSVVEINGHSPILASSGAMLLFVGWLGFNGGSTLAGSSATGHIIFNTVIGATTGGLGGLIIGFFIGRVFRPEHSINGMLGGLAAVTAGCDVLTGGGAAMVGIIGSMACMGVTALLLKFRIDDAIGAVAVHAGAGSVGTMALALIAPLSSLPLESRLEQLGVQSLGVLICFVWAFGSGMVLFKTINWFIALRVSEQDEKDGLNIAEHGSSLSMVEVINSLEDLTTGDADLSSRLDVEDGDDAADLAILFNKLMEKLEVEEKRRKFEVDQQDRKAEMTRWKEAKQIEAERKKRQEEQEIVDKISETLSAMKEGILDRRIETRQATGSLRVVADGVNILMDFTAGLIAKIGRQAEELHDVALLQSQAAERLLDSSQEQNGNIEAVSASIMDMSTNLDKTKSVVSGSRENTVMAVEKSNAGLQASQTAEVAIEEMRVASAQALSVVKSISDVSQQMNMIAINASVEAVSAGDSGKSFGIVADEVRRLAGSCEEMSNSVRDSLVKVEEKVGICSDSIEATVGTLKDMNSTAAEVMESMNEIRRYAEDQAFESNQLRNTISEVSRSVASNRSAAEKLSNQADNLKQNAFLLTGLMRWKGSGGNNKQGVA